MNSDTADSDCDILLDIWNGNSGINMPRGSRDHFLSKATYLLLGDMGWGITVLGACQGLGVGPSAANPADDGNMTPPVDNST